MQAVATLPAAPSTETAANCAEPAKVVADMTMSQVPGPGTDFKILSPGSPSASGHAGASSP